MIEKYSENSLSALLMGLILMSIILISCVLAVPFSVMFILIYKGRSEMMSIFFSQ